MPPYAICFTDRCDYLFDFNENESNQPSRLPPQHCPTCKGRVIFYCPVCRWPILMVPDQECPRCGNCSARFRQSFDSHSERSVGSKIIQVDSRSPKEAGNARDGTDMALGRSPAPCRQSLEQTRPDRAASADLRIHYSAHRHRKVL
jgi:hypothetical protein